MDDPDRLRLDDPRLLEGPEQLAHRLGPIFDNEHDELALLLGHNLGLLHEGGCGAAGGRGGGGGGWRRLRLYVEVELGLQLSELVFHHAFVVAAVVRTRLLEYNRHTTIDDRPMIYLFISTCCSWFNYTLKLIFMEENIQMKIQGQNSTIISPLFRLYLQVIQCLLL